MHASNPRDTLHDNSSKFNRTGPKSTSGKARSARNALKHGLTSKKLHLPGEDPQEFEHFLTDVMATLHPVGALESELAREVAMTTWKVRRLEIWEASQTRLRASSDQHSCNDSIKAIEEKICEHRSAIGNLQRDPASEPPLIVRLSNMPSTKQFEHFEVEDLYYEWIDSLTEQVPIVPLAKISKRIQTDEPAQPSACQSPNAADGVECKPTESESESSAEGRNWSLAQVQQLIGEFARIEGMSSEQFARAAESRWRAGLQDQRIRLRQRRAEVRRTIKQLEQQKQDLLLEKSSPDPQRIELINRYVTAVAKQREKSLKTLHELQRSRRKNGRRTQSSE